MKLLRFHCSEAKEYPDSESTFPEFLRATWEAGVISYDVDFEKRTCTYFGANGEAYKEEYPAVEIEKSSASD